MIEPGPGGGAPGLFPFVYVGVMIVFTILVLTALILLIRYLVVVTRAARIYIDTHTSVAPMVAEPPPATKAVRSRKPSSTE
jgi:hypothetical protein